MRPDAVYGLVEVTWPAADRQLVLAKLYLFPNAHHVMYAWGGRGPSPGPGTPDQTEKQLALEAQVELEQKEKEVWKER